jgi:hypothetical protein
MSNAAYNRKVLKNYFDMVEDEVIAVQKKIVKDGLQKLFNKSPHKGIGKTAKSEYDANHKISIDGSAFGGHKKATHSKTISKGLNKAQQSKTNKIKFGSNVTITNDTAHALNVETGLAWSEQPGYYPYRSTRNYLKNKYRKVLSVGVK